MLPNPIPKPGGSEGMTRVPARVNTTPVPLMLRQCGKTRPEARAFRACGGAARKGSRATEAPGEISPVPPLQWKRGAPSIALSRFGAAPAPCAAKGFLRKFRSNALVIAKRSTIYLLLRFGATPWSRKERSSAGPFPGLFPLRPQQAHQRDKSHARMLYMRSRRAQNPAKPAFFENVDFVILGC